MNQAAAEIGTTGLDQLPTHTCATIRTLELEDDDSRRLKTLGLCVGRHIEVVKHGNPMIVRVFASRLGLAAELAARVRVEPCAAGCCCALHIRDRRV